MILASSLTTWYAVRGSGLVALVLLTASVVLGVISLGRWQSPVWPRFATQHLHRNVSLLAVVFLALHIATTVIDGFAPIGWLDAVIPFLSPYRPLWLGLGAVAFDLVLAVIITSMLRRRMSYSVWRTVHLTSWASWPIAMIHGLGTGSDSMTRWAQLVYVACGLAVLAACWFRLAVGSGVGPRARLVAGILSIVLPIAVLAWAANGPLKPNWARRAGTPPSPLSSTSSDATGSP